MTFDVDRGRKTVVPVVDIAGWTSGHGDQHRSIATAVDRACRDVGFLQVVGHGIDDAVIAGLAESIHWLFTLPADTKRRWAAPRPSINRGYTPPRAERLSASLGVASPDDLFEAFNVGAARSDYPDLDLDGEIYAENIWPDPSDDQYGEPAARFREDVERWFTAAGTVARRMTEIFALALDLPHDHFDRYTDHSIDVLRMNHYPQTDERELGDELGMGAHTDYGIVTVLWADPVPGLEILRPDGSWLGVVPIPGALLINLGDLLERWTGDRWTSTMHRVVPPRDEAGRLVARRSAAFFHDGNADAVISTLPSCVDEPGGARPDITVAEHLAQKLAGSRSLELNPYAEREASRISFRRSHA